MVKLSKTPPNPLRIALVQPRKKVGKALRIEKSPTGIQALAAYLESYGWPVDLFHIALEAESLKQVISLSPDVIGLSSFTSNFPEAYRMAQEFKQHLPDSTLVLGGWHASGCAVSYLQGHESWSLGEILSEFSPFEFVVVGEGEKPLLNMLDLLSEKAPITDLRWRNIQGLGFLDEKGEISISGPSRVNDRDILPQPSWKGLDVDIYRDPKRANCLDLSIHAKRGCRFNCSFCATPTAYPGGIYCQSVEWTTRYIDWLREVFSPKTITFTDEDFMGDYDWLRDLCEALIEKGLNEDISYDSFGSIVDVRKLHRQGLLQRMREAGFLSFFAGIESLNPAALEKFKRPVNGSGEELLKNYMGEIQKAVMLSRKSGLIFMADYMLGFFGESREETELGFRHLMDIRGIPYIYLPTFTPFPGTSLWQTAIEKNLLIRKNDGTIPWELYDCSHQVITLDYDVAGVRDECEQLFFSCQVYRKDALDDIEAYPERKPELYVPLFEKLHQDYPRNRAIEENLKAFVNA